MKTLKVVNIKCGGCEAGIKDALTKAGLKDVKVDHTCQEIIFEGDENKAKEILTKMGYPEVNSKEAKSLLKKAKSFYSCAIGKIKK